MISIDIYHDISKTGNFLTLAGIADLHLLIDSDEPDAFQPVDPESFAYLKYCYNELKSNPKFFGRTMFFSGGDLTELERYSVRTAKKSFLRKNDSKAEDMIYKNSLNKFILPKIRRLVGKKEFIGGVAGNHLMEFCDKKNGENSEEYIIKKLGGKYFGEGKALLNFHFEYKKDHRCIKKVIILHGTKAGTKQSTIKELEKIVSQYGQIDLVIKCHAHDPMTHFHCRYHLPDTNTGKIKKVETLVMCLGSTRGGEVIGYDDYTERGNWPPLAGRFPVAIFHAHKPDSNNHCLEIKIRPYTM